MKTLTGEEAKHLWASGVTLEVKANYDLTNDHWSDVDETCSLGIFDAEDYTFRVKALMCKLGGKVFKPPQKIAPAKRTKYYLTLTALKGTGYLWEGTNYEEQLLKQGFVHLELDDALSHMKALIEITKRSIGNDKHF